LDFRKICARSVNYNSDATSRLYRYCQTTADAGVFVITKPIHNQHIARSEKLYCMVQ
jgi:hypothetical protein